MRKAKSKQKSKTTRAPRRRRITIRDGDHLTLVDRHGQACIEVEFRGGEAMLTIDVLGGDGTLNNPVGLSIDPTALNHTWPEGS
ncbi:MAG TPA: hypothetical protein VJZ91_09005 [Blastocatellia bacterium]|nr:hypothetical protein [Blastocatellia bacterium]